MSAHGRWGPSRRSLRDLLREPGGGPRDLLREPGVGPRELPGGRRRDEAGSIAPLIIGFMLVVAVLVAVVVDASAAYLRRQSLNATADAAALAATDGLQGEAVYTEGLGRTAQIDPVAARGFVAAYVAGSGAARRYPGLDWEVRTTDDTVVVRLSAPLDLPLRVPGVADGVRVTGEAASIVVIAD